MKKKQKNMLTMKDRIVNIFKESECETERSNERMSGIACEDLFLGMDCSYKRLIPLG